MRSKSRVRLLVRCMLTAGLTAGIFTSGSAATAEAETEQASLAAAAEAETEQASPAVAAEAETQTTETTQKTESNQDFSAIASGSDMAEVENVVEDWMVPIAADALENGVYPVQVDSSSSMFKIEDAVLAVGEDGMTAVMTMSGTGYLYLYMGTGEEAAEASEEDYIPFEENEEGQHTFTVPVEALDQGIDCCAFSKKKEQWYDRTLVFRSDSLPADAFKDLEMTTAADLGLADGTYEIDAVLQGGSGKASIESPAQITVADGEVTARIVMSSKNYDYALLGEEKIEATYDEKTGHSVFEIPVEGFDWNMPFTADTVAMSTPHEINYTIYMDSATLEPAA